MVKNKLRYVYLVRVNSVIEELNTSQIMHFLLDLGSCESQEPPTRQLQRKERVIKNTNFFI